jgi:hypothetical protein
MVERTNGNDFLRYARLILEQGLLPSEQRAILDQMAKIEEDRGNYEEARKIYKIQLEKAKIDTQDKDRGGIYRILSELVRLAFLQGDDVDAKLVLEDKLQIAISRGNNKEQVNALYELCKLQVQMGNLNDADVLCRDAVEISRQIEYRVGETDVLTLQGSIQFGLKKFKSAFDFYEAALHHSLAMNDHMRSSVIRSQMEVLNTIMGKQIFISYSHHDRGFVEQLAKDLKFAGFPVWWDEWEIKVGHSIIKKVSEGIGKSAYLAIVLSPSSVESDFVQRELNSALVTQLKSKKIEILPLLISDCEVPLLLIDTHYADFRLDYQSGFRKLLDRLTDTPTID